MSQLKARLYSNLAHANMSVPASSSAHDSDTVAATYSIPGKVFLLGEYAVLAGHPALVASLSPRFEMKVSVAKQPGELGVAGEDGSLIPPGSPLHRLMKWAEEQKLPKLNFEFRDPYLGKGGFGASTAEFAMAWMAYSQFDEKTPPAWNRNWRTPLSLYRNLMTSEPLLPSGADLVAQWQGGISLYNPTEKYCRDVWPIMDWSRCLVFSATHQKDRKVKTHEHLLKLAQSGFPETASDWLDPLKAVILRGINAVQDQDFESLGKSFNEYAEVLAHVGLEHGQTHLDRKAFMNIPGVIGAKGTGALQADGLIVLFSAQSRESTLAEILDEARQRDLCLVSEGFTSQMGITCQI